MEICRQMCIANEETDQNDFENLAVRVPAVDPFANFHAAANTEINADMMMALLRRLGPVVRKRENLMPKEDFNNLMRMANIEQKSLLMHVISKLLDSESQPIQMFFTGPAGCGKTFVIKLLMEIYNRFTETDGYCNGYITCASTGKATVAINGLTIHTALKISIGKNLPLSNEVVQQFRTLLKYVRCIIIDEISMMSAELVHQVDARLKQITEDYDRAFGGKDIFLIGDLRQLPPVRATPIFNQIKMSLAGPMLWRGLQFYQLTQVMRQSNAIFSRIPTKIGDGEKLEADE
ncbi:ATP-dependent DNA helicase [Trichonephila clavata]|uniref:ATP-dependent DNA helicase n=1 Tax=Trichonephila clavata TaxID=2740835 RepID=A0A8X6FDZ6_TRICU|nr:ATP-dependent DNA helicase [Trichonephila clavata]